MIKIDFHDLFKDTPEKDKEKSKKIEYAVEMLRKEFREPKTEEKNNV